MKETLGHVFYAISDKLKLWNFVLVAIILLGLFGLIFGQQFYGMIDQKVFPQHPKPEVTAETSEQQRGTMVIDAITHQMQYELGSTFGWSANDIPISVSYPLYLDNRAYRQIGVYNATRIMVDIYSRVIAKLGNNDRENEHLYRAKTSYFPIAPTRWGMLGVREGAESAYQKGLKEIDIYKRDLLAGKAVYNCKTDDIYVSLMTITGDQVIGYALGLLENSDELPWYVLDNRIYEAQGMVLVVRDYIQAIYHIYPQIAAKNNEENFERAMFYMNKICEYDPIYIANNPFNNGSVIRSYLLNVKNRLEDIANSLRI